MHARSTAVHRLPLVLLSALLLLAGALLAAAPLDAPPAHASDDVTWTVRTASNDQGKARTNFSYLIRPGETVRDGLVIVNRSRQSLDLGVYAADGFTTVSGGFDLQLADAKPRALGAWVRAGKGRVELAPGKTITVPFTVTVPKNATPGDYAGGIVTSMAAVDEATAQGQGVTVDRRLGIRLTVRVDGPLRPAVAVDQVRLGWNGGLNPFAGGDAEVSYTVRNTGNAIIGAQDAVTVAGPFGWLPRHASGTETMPKLLPGEAWTQRVTLRDVPPLLLLTATASVSPTATDASGSTSALPIVTASGTAPAVPWTLLVLLAAVILLAILVPRRLKARRAARRSREEQRVQQAVAEALAERDSRESVPAS